MPFAFDMHSVGKVTAILLSWKRWRNIPPIAERLRSTHVVDEIIIWNNNPDLRFGDPGYTVINSTHNYKAYARYAAAMLARNQTILFQDDDFMLARDDIANLYEKQQNDPTRIFGIEGRNLQQGRYVRESAFGMVDIVLGQFMLFSKELLAKVYGDILRLAPIDRGDDIAFSLLVGEKHICVPTRRVDLGHGDESALWRQPGHFEKRQAMIDKILRAHKRHG